MTNRFFTAYVTIMILIAVMIAGALKTPEITAEKAQKPRLTIKRVNYTFTTKTAVKRNISANTEAPEITPAPTPDPTATPTAEPTPTPTATPTPAPTATPKPTAEPTPEPTPKVYRFLATSYSSAPEENGGFGAVDCKYGQPLPDNAIAAELDLLPYGTRVYIEGIGERIVVDTASSKTIAKMHGRAIERNCVGWIDIYCGDNVDWAHWWGVREVELIILEWGEGK